MRAAICENLDWFASWWIRARNASIQGEDRF